MAFWPALLLALCCSAEQSSSRILVLHRTAGFRHDSIPAAIELMQRIGGERGYAVDFTEDNAYFRDDILRQYQAVVFLMTSGDILNDEEVRVLDRYIENGGGFMGVHSAADTEHESDLFHSLLGAEFRSHPAIQEARINVEDRIHPSTAALPSPWLVTDEIYDFVRSPRGAVHVLANADEQSYFGGSMRGDHPISWCQERGLGRTWYTALGHPTERYQNDFFFRRHLEGGLDYVLGRITTECRSRNGLGEGAAMKTFADSAGTIPQGATRVGALRLERSAAPAASYQFTGRIMPRYSESYTFRLVANGHATLQINGREILATGGGASVAKLDVTAGSLMTVNLTYRPSSEPLLELYWNSISQPDEIISVPQLYPPPERTRGARRSP